MRSVLLLFVMVLASSSFAQTTKLDKSLRIATYASAVADAETTIAALKTPGVYERNPVAKPFTKNRATMYAFSLSGAIGADFISRKMGRSQKWRKWRWIPHVLVIGINTWAISTNARTLSRH